MSGTNGTTASERVWFITGSSSGLGRAMARAALENGDRVVATVRKLGDGDGLANNDDAAKRLATVQVDVTQPGQVSKAVDVAVQEFGTIDVLFNNAGYSLCAGIEEASDAEIVEQFETNTFGAFRVARSVLPVMRSKRSGFIVMVSSVAAISTPAGLGYYGASKHAVEGFSEALAKEVEPLGIKVTAIQPGLFKTDALGRSMRSSAAIAEYADSVGQLRTALPSIDGQQPGDPAALASVILRLVDVPEPPLFLAIDPGATPEVRPRLEQRLSEMNEWSTWATPGTDWLSTRERESM